MDCVRSDSLQNSFNFEFSVLLIYSLMSYGNSQGHPLDFNCFYPIVIQRVWNSMAPFVRDDCAFYIRSRDFSKKIFCFLKHSFHWVISAELKQCLMHHVTCLARSYWPMIVSLYFHVRSDTKLLFVRIYIISPLISVLGGWLCRLGLRLFLFKSLQERSLTVLGWIKQLCKVFLRTKLRQIIL